MTINLHHSCLLVLALALPLACTDDGPEELAPEDKTPFECEIGVLDDDGTFVPGSSETRAELDLGFQGFLFVQTRVRASGEVPQRVEVTIRTTIEGEVPTGATVPELKMSLESEGKVLSEELLIFFNSSTPAELEMLGVEIAIRLESPTHICMAESDFLLVDDDPCIHTGDEPICPETDETDSGSS